jgi:hypothetical protein
LRERGGVFDGSMFAKFGSDLSEALDPPLRVTVKGSIEDASIESVGEVGASGDVEVAERVGMRLENVLDIIGVSHKIGRLCEAWVNWRNTYHVAILLA